MLESIIEATKNFCIHQLQLEPSLEECLEIPKEVITTSIEVDTQTDETLTIYLFAQKDFIQSIANALLFEEESDEETLVDMALESTNLIVGNAKVVASQNGLHFTIKTPKLSTDIPSIEQLTSLQKIRCNTTSLIVALKKGNV